MHSFCPIVLNFQNGHFDDGYRSIFTTIKKKSRDKGIGITRNEDKDGFSLFGFDLSPSICVGGHQKKKSKRRRNLRLLLQFGQPLETTTIILYPDYDNLITVYKSKLVLKDY